MSNIGKQIIDIPDGVTLSIDSNLIVVKGKMGELTMECNKEIALEHSDNTLAVKRASDSRRDKELHGLSRALIANMIKGVTEGYSKELQMNGVGYTAEIKGNFLLVNAGYSHAVYVEIPTGIKIETPNQTTIVVSGIDKQNVGDMSAKIRSIRKPEPYKGKGIKYSTETIRRKAGKTVGAGGQ